MMIIINWVLVNLRDTVCALRAGLTIRGAPYQRKTGALFSHTYPGFEFFSLAGCTFLLPKS